MAEWQNELYQNYIAGKMSQQGRSNYEADVISGIIQAPEGSVGPWAKLAEGYVEQGRRTPTRRPLFLPEGYKCSSLFICFHS